MPGERFMSNLDTARANILKKYGEGALMSLADKGLDVEAIPSGNIALDIALGIGGYPKGRIVEVYGPESSGKTTLALHAIAETQKQDGICAFIDAEHALDPRYAKAIGVETDDLLISQPDYGEQALEICDELVKSGEVSLIIIDSVAALTPQAEIAGEMGDSHVGLQARLMSQALRKLNGMAQQTGTVLFFINQLREKIGVMFGSPETTPGGRALKFYASQRLDIRRREAIKDGVEVIGNHTRIKVVKNKVAPPFREAEVDIMYGEGMSAEGSLLDIGVARGVIRKSGAWYYDSADNKLGQGREAAKAHLRNNQDLAANIYQEIVAAE